MTKEEGLILAKKYKLEHEFLESYQQEVNNGYSEGEAVAFALREWDL